MSEIKPYINQGDWGRDLLKRLNNLTGPNGDINTWTEYPLVGPDGSPLGSQHKGYMGILGVNGESKIIYWNGTQWDILMETPVVLDGEPVDSVSFSKETTNGVAVDLGLETSSIILVDAKASLNVSCYDKVSGNEVWTSSAPLGSGYIYSTFANTVQEVVADNENIYVGVSEYSAIPIQSGATLGIAIFCFQKSNGAFRWRTFLGTSTIPVYLTMVAGAGGFLFVSVYPSRRIVKINSSSGGIAVDFSFSSGFVILGWRRIAWNSEANQVILIGQSGTTLTLHTFPADLSTVQYSYTNNSTYSRSYLAAFQDQIDPAIVYFWDINNGLIRLVGYNGTNNTTSIKATLASSDWLDALPGSLLGAGRIGTDFLLVIPGLVSQTLKLSPDGTVSVESVTKPYGDGMLLPCSEIRMENPQEISFFSKQKTKTLGLGTSLTRIIEVDISSSGERIGFLLNAVLTNRADKRSCVSSANFSSLSSDIFVSKKTETLSLHSAESMAAYAQPEERQSAGIFVGQNFSVFAMNGEASNAFLSGYSGGGRYLSGIGWGCECVNGQLTPTFSQNLSLGAMLFDRGAGKFIIQSSPPQPLNEPITGFPGTSGLFITNTNNFGFGVESPTYKVTVSGTLQATEVRNSGGVVTSDPRMKLNMASLSGAESWEIINLLDAISFVYKPDFSVTITEVTQDEEGNEVVNTYTDNPPLPQGIQIGYNADMVSETLPELVDIESRSGIKYLNIGAIAPIVHQGTVWKINQLQQIIEQQQALIESLTARVEALENAA